ncbi:MAG: alpha/beta hydrolase [bacterium]|jgi:acetyl esterase/lipase|nr:alpha/beta hydrolase [bacterium]
MNVTPAERRIRAMLPLVRLMQRHPPLRLANRYMQKRTANLRPHKNVINRSETIVGVRCQWLIPPDCPENRVLLYLHGGGFVFGLTPMHLKMAASLALRMKTRILLPDYRTAPEYPFPAALEDCENVYLWLLKKDIPAGNITLAGDSAGGNLVLSLMMKCRDSGAALPAAAALLSPAVKLGGGTSRPGFRDPLLPPKAMEFYTRAYVAEHDPRDPLISPLYGDLRGLPPLLIHAGEDEILRDEALQLAEKARAAGTDAELEIFPRMWHVWQLFPALPQTRQSLDAIAGFLISYTGD